MKKKNKKVSQRNFSFFRVIHFCNYLFKFTYKTLPREIRYNKHIPFILFLVCSTHFQNQLCIKLMSILLGHFSRYMKEKDNSPGAIYLEKYFVDLSWYVLCPPKLLFLVYILSTHTLFCSICFLNISYFYITYFFYLSYFS